jgi:uncharacterized membrane protein
MGSHFVLAPHVTPGNWFGLAATVFGGVLAVWALLVASAVFVWRSCNVIATVLDVGMFRTAGLLFLIGAAAAIIVVGFPVILIAEILLAVAFFSISEQSRVTPVGQVQTVTPATSS